MEDIHNEKIVDAVFVIGTGSKNNNEELKYALRNLEKNCPFVRTVYISGECPEWVDTSIVKHLPWPDRFSHAKDANIIDKLRHACEFPGIAKNILFCSDDQFQTRRCTWEDFSPRWLRQYTPTDRWYEDRKRIWHSRLKKTLERARLNRIERNMNPETVYYYQPHMWMQIDRDLFIEYAQWSDYEHREDTIIASGYFNFIDAGGDTNNDHRFISVAQDWPVKETHIAYSDPSYSTAMSYLRKTFYNKSKFEINENKKMTTTTSEVSGDTSPTVTIDSAYVLDVKNKILSSGVWNTLKTDVEDAEELRSKNVAGWETVWQDIIDRWSSITDNGKLLVPIVKTRSPEASALVTKHKGSAEKHVCTPCEERRRKAEEEQKKLDEHRNRYEEERSIQEIRSIEARKKISISEIKDRMSMEIERIETQAAEEIKDIEAHILKLTGHALSYDHNTSELPSVYEELSRKMTVSEENACIDCTVDHISSAIAHLNSNMNNPTLEDIELARGEVIVASQHLLALHHTEEYNMCVKVLDSVQTEKSMFSIASLRRILTKAIEKKHNL